MTGIILDAILMLLLVAALGYGVRLEKKLTLLRSGQIAFAGAVTELNAAAGRAEAALASLRTSGEEADMLHDRILKARAVKQELETLIARSERTPAPRTSDAGVAPAAPQAQRAASPSLRDREEKPFSFPSRGAATEGATPSLLSREQRDIFAPVLHALTANQAAKQTLNRARPSLDEDLFAA